MDIYIFSRGTTHSQGFSWRKITEEGEEPAEPNIPPKFNNLIDPNESLPSLNSLVLGRFDGKLILYIAGLEASERQDNQLRQLYNSVVCIGQNSDDEALIQALTVKALQDKLSGILNNVVKSSSDGSVEISSHELFNEFQKLNSSAIYGELSPIKTNKLGESSQERKQQLAEEIAQLKHFPKKKNYLVVVTTISDKKNLENAGVWRGLSEKITSDNEQWEDVPQSGQPSINNLLELLKNNIQEFISQKTTSFLTAFLVCLLFINLGLIYYNNITFPANRKQKINQLEIEYQQLEKDRKTLRSKNQVLEDLVKNKLAQFKNLKQTLEDLQRQRDQLNAQIKNDERRIQILDRQKLQQTLKK